MTKQSILPPLGAHMPISGGLVRAVERIASLGGTALQIFSRNQRQWKVPELDPEEAASFREAVTDWGGHLVINHDSYLTNLAATEEDLAEKSRTSFARELKRTEALGIPYLVTHPGARKEQTVADGIATYATNLDAAIEASETSEPLVLLEITAGQGTVLGSNFEELARIIEASNHPDRLGICYDTCHAFCAGYDIRDEATYTATFEELEQTLGLERLRAFHLNDSKNPFQSNKDRHEHIGQGHLGETPFKLLLTDPRFANIPMVIETPKDNDLEDDKKNLALLRKLAGA